MYESSLTARQDGRPSIGLALGSGAARGWAHIGVIAALEKEGIRPDVVCGCSIGALVGAAYVSGKVVDLGEWVSSLQWHDVVSMLDLSFRGGLIRGEKVLAHCARHFFTEDFKDVDRPFACVATELASGREVWLRDGGLADAVRASIALPGLFSPVERKGRVLVDGGLVNPVPVSLCRALGADIVIAVELGSGLVGRTHGRTLAKAIQPAEEGIAGKLLGKLGIGNGGSPESDGMPSLADVVASSINIMQMRIARSRLAGEPADVLIAPRVAQLEMMEFHRAKEAIDEGHEAVARVRATLMHVLERD
ncbi:MAG: patatin-like phospholipase RssA [Pseudazoarcus pumilus]|nr:patatin-like phospholipase RssA [Pseudazoarcus pumilus]